jgi:hypothetical protein
LRISEQIRPREFLAEYSSKLVQLTRKCEARYREMNARFLAIASTMGIALSEAEIRKTSEIVRQLREEVKTR